MRGYSLDLRERIVAAHEAGQRAAQVAAVFGVAEATVWRYLYAHRRGQSLAGRTSPGKPHLMKPEQHDLLRQQVEQHPDRTLQEHADLWFAQTGVRVSFKTMDRMLERLGVTRKKGRPRV
ncbi:IS630 transposase-related protein [Deinococcus peraridilitoris]|uniref:IS630 transposase-related protein n=1 Tax=Deinococcus peraridilitoris TaxID=432329 RepID=UPI00059C40F3|nr:IS630 transposase-related protein [Deinococcus peraridilitoris]